MAITFVGGYAADDGGSGNVTDPVDLTLPSHASGDVGYIMAGHSVSGTSVSTFNSIDGWTSLGTITWAAGSDGYMELWRRVFTSASETNPSVNTAVSSRKVASVVVFRGVDNTTPEDVTPTESNNSNSLNFAAAAITPANNCGILLFQYSAYAAVNDAITTLGAPATPTGLTILADGLGSSIGGGLFRDLACAYDVDGGTALATYTPGAWTHSATATDTQEVGNFTIALRPAAAAGSRPQNPLGHPLYGPFGGPIG